MTHTVVTWNGQPFEPFAHETEDGAREYIAEFVEFHGTEPGATAEKIDADAWAVRVAGELITIAIVSRELDG